jgi:hypothetical protein
MMAIIAMVAVIEPVLAQEKESAPDLQLMSLKQIRVATSNPKLKPKRNLCGMW